MRSTTAKPMYDVRMYDVRRMYDLFTIYRFAGFPIYAADNRQFKKKHTREDVLFLPSYIVPSYINCPFYIVPSYINCTSYIVPSYIFLAFFVHFVM